MLRILNDKRMIRAIWYAPLKEPLSVGTNSITRIEAYREDDDSIWFTVWFGNVVLFRVNSIHIATIEYDVSSDKNEEGDRSGDHRCGQQKQVGTILCATCKEMKPPDVFNFGNIETICDDCRWADRV